MTKSFKSEPYQASVVRHLRALAKQAGDVLCDRESRAMYEALELLRLMADGQTPDELRKTIIVTSRQERQLRGVLLPEALEKLIKFRSRVLIHFNRMLKDDHLPDLLKEIAGRRAELVARFQIDHKHNNKREDTDDFDNDEILSVHDFV